MHSRVGDLLARMAPKDVQLFPAEVETQRERYFLVNVIRIVKCIDDQASEEVSYWTEKDGLPEKTGTYFSVAGMRIDPTQVGDAKVFRTWGWHIALIVSEELKEALERIRATGLKFKEV
ncbi:imm11 family protein [Archangium sp.]|uniref:imm11 family protein n=1 Tax=Archangium sp. TaxID=1872627 RepID=UPI00389A46EE